jgi:hypothetical protein
LLVLSGHIVYGVDGRLVVKKISRGEVMNCLVEMAKAKGRSYITPEDVGDALEKCVTPNDTDIVRLDLLEVLGNQTGFSAEDYGLCAFIAWKAEVNQLP